MGQAAPRPGRTFTPRRLSFGSLKLASSASRGARCFGSSRSLFAPGLLHLSHFGTIYQGLSGKFFQAVKEFAGESPDSARMLRINIIGFPDEVASQYAADQELQDIIKLYGFMKHEEAVEAMRSSDFLLLFLAHHDFSRLAVPGKLYEYIQIGRPILAFVLPDSPAERILAKSGIAYQCAYASDSPDVFDDSVLNFFNLDNVARRPSVWFEETFNTQHHAEQLYDLIRRIHGTSSLAASEMQAHETPGA